MGSTCQEPSFWHWQGLSGQPSPPWGPRKLEKVRYCFLLSWGWLLPSWLPSYGPTRPLHPPSSVPSGRGHTKAGLWLEGPGRSFCPKSLLNRPQLQPKPLQLVPLDQTLELTHDCCSVLLHSPQGLFIPSESPFRPFLSPLPKPWSKPPSSLPWILHQTPCWSPFPHPLISLRTIVLGRIARMIFLNWLCHSSSWECVPSPLFSPVKSFSCCQSPISNATFPTKPLHSFFKHLLST